MKKVRVGVIGVGYLGQHHARLYSSLPDATLIGVTDADLVRTAEIATQFGANAFPDAAALLQEVDAVSIAVPTSAHHAVVKTALKAGVHVLVEKPITVTRSEALELIELAGRQNLVLQVGHIERFNPAIQALRPYIGTPSFIECIRLSPFGTRALDVDVVRDLMIHDLDILLSMNLGPIEQVQAAGVCILSSRIDAANVRITFGNGCVANLSASRVATSPLRELKLYYPDSFIMVDYRTRSVTIQRRNPEGNGGSIVPIHSPEQVTEEPLNLELQSFVNSIISHTAPLVSGADGLAALDLADQVTNVIEGFIRQQESNRQSVAVSK
ncbi:MAG: Gfo/Idh/MocA family oxidoreductase [Nitrospira sp.]